MVLALPPLHPGQREVFQDPSRFRVVVAGRRWGKTRLAVVEAIAAAARGGTAWWVAPTYDMARAGWDTIVGLVGHLPGVQVRVAARQVRLPSGGTIWVRSAEHPQRLRAFGLDMLVLDEAAFVRREVWTEALRPALADRQGRALFISTPYGRNWFWELVQFAQTAPHWRVWRFPSSANPYLRPEELEAMRRDMPAHIYRQEVEGEFVEGAVGLVRSEWIRHGEPPPGSPTYMGVDLAISQAQDADYSAIVVMARDREGRIYVLEAIRGHWTFHDTMRAIVNTASRYAPAAIAIEAAQYQLAMVQELARTTSLPVRPVRPRGSKLERAQILGLRYEQGLVYHAKPLPDYERELREFPMSPHDDMVDAAVYALLAASGHGLRYVEQLQRAAR